MSFFKKLDELISKDKLFHFFFGALFFVIFSAFGAFYGLVAVAIIAALKELHDHLYGGHVEFKDFLWTVFGGAVCDVCYIIGALNGF